MSRYMDRSRSRYRRTTPEEVVDLIRDGTVANIDPPPRTPYQYRENNKKQKAILLFLSGLVNKSLPILGRQGKIIQVVIDYYRDPTEQKLKTILYNLVQNIQFETPSLGDTIRFITLDDNYRGVERYTDQRGGSKDKQKRRKKLRKKRTHKKGKRTQRK